jgi:hypothetical protein
MARPTKLTTKLAEDICVRIRAGCFPYIAAESVGVGRSTFYRWLQSGRGSRAKKEFRDFRDKVLRAGAEARVLAECKLYKTDPFAWLRSGPGREDWGDKATGPMFAINNVNAQYDAPSAAPEPVGNFGQALAAMEAAGMIRITDAGKAAFSSAEMQEQPEI